MIKIKQLLAKVLEKIKPSKKEILEEEIFSRKLIEKVRKTGRGQVEVLLAGSLARGTHLKGDRDIDIFVLFPEDYSRKEFEREGLRIGKAVFRGHKWEKAYSEHPYIRGEISGFKVDIVPSYKITGTESKKSAVDRSPFHNAYLQKKLSEKQKDEVRLLRQFLKGVKAYGAELKTSSVPGYVTELLILNYGDFESTIKAVAKWEKEEVIDIEKQLAEDYARKTFGAPLIVVDPVDKNRNVAAALSLNQFSRVIAAARAFLKKPSTNFFFGKKAKTLTAAQAKKFIEKEGLIVIEFSYPAKTVSDVFWGQLKRMRKKIVNELERKEFAVLRSSEWTDEKMHAVIVFDLKSNKLERAAKRVGPEVTNEPHSERFLKFHKNPLSGPRIEHGRWVVEIERKHWVATIFLKELLKKLSQTEKANIARALKKRSGVMADPKVLAFYNKNKAFKEWFSSYLKGKEEFGEY
ncbi:MAG: CCA tRNA nucleotidyltransferase [Candidatus Diapherotrites archaeon]|uniref:CCA-adding enzyme n=1 Tax=Candidatus Iainarchaeum sp. TaxID=3101447 RepID=A0A8T4L1F7_9ARCH|nr:MAG: tRNA nucleotidyltransferase CCA-adding enzyme [archaeon GW2011_AR10]MBS3059319.1 CCA tRNA nucleotidyltransferase [Candidatus Diapherotrites archaeon]